MTPSSMEPAAPRSIAQSLRRKPDPASAILLRALAAALALAAGIAAALMFLQYAAATRLSDESFIAAGLLGVSTAWLSWGAALGLIGLWPRVAVRPEVGTITGRTVIVVPICNEDAETTFARVAAMHQQLGAVTRGTGVIIDFAILSDTRSAEGSAAEMAALERLIEIAKPSNQTVPGGRIFYRRRTQNIGRKAGNIAEFLRRSGAEWDFALVLDADSLMEAQTILTMIRRIEAVQDLGLLQTLPRIIRAKSRFGRAMQFSAGFHGPVFTRGLARLQGRTGPYWGHNAIMRINAFAASCGLSELPGKPPFGGHILSHDYVEAALLARGGWQVRVDPDLGGSYEESPENLVEHAKRDRRWCQGNLQHGGLLRTNGLRFWNRATFVQGIMAYLSSGLWAAFLVAATLAGAGQSAHNYFPDLAPMYDGSIRFLPVFPSDESAKALGLLIGIFGLLLLPKLLVALEAALTGRSRSHGGIFRSVASVLAELVLSALLAPILMAFQVRALLQIMLGRDGGWPANMRGDGSMSIAESYEASKFVVIAGALALIGAWYLAPGQVPWLLPVLVPMILSPLIISWTSRQQSGGLFPMPEDRERPAVVALHDEILAGWRSSADHANASISALSFDGAMN